MRKPRHRVRVCMLFVNMCNRIKSISKLTRIKVFFNFFHRESVFGIIVG